MPAAHACAGSGNGYAPVMQGLALSRPRNPAL
jgi:hypothetical protein